MNQLLCSNTRSTAAKPSRAPTSLLVVVSPFDQQGNQGTGA